MVKKGFSFEDADNRNKNRNRKKSTSTLTWKQPDVETGRKNVYLNYYDDSLQIDYNLVCKEYANAVYGKLQDGGHVEAEIVRKCGLNPEQQILLHRSLANYVCEFTVSRRGITRHYVKLVKSPR